MPIKVYKVDVNSKGMIFGDNEIADKN